MPAPLRSFARPAPWLFACIAPWLSLSVCGCDVDHGPPFGDDSAPSCEATDSCDAGKTPDGPDAGCGDDCDAAALDAHATQDAAPVVDAAPVADATPQGKCGDGIVQAGEACDGARIVTDAGMGDRVSCSADCKQLIQEDACEQCQQRECTVFEQVDLVGGCFRKVDTSFGADAADMRFVADCIALADCAVRKGCAFQGELVFRPCYCGSATADACDSEGPAADAPCLAEFRKAARAESHVGVVMNWSDLQYPVTWAYKLFECTQQRCAAECTKP